LAALQLPFLGSSFRWREFGHQGGAVAAEGVQIDLFVVGGPILPAAVGDADPLGRQGPHRGVVFGALVPLLLVYIRA
jgi:hypothetical protein